MSDEETPNFEFDEKHTFVKGEKIYAIDDNGFDIYEAEIEDIKDGKYKIHYPEYPDDDKEVENTKTLLVRSEANKKIYDEQEKVRVERENEEEEMAEEEEEEKEEKKPKKQGKK